MTSAADARRYSRSPPPVKLAYTGFPDARNAWTASRTSLILAHPQSRELMWSTSAAMWSSSAACRNPNATFQRSGREGRNQSTA